MNNREIIDIIKKQGRVCLQEKSGFRFELIDPGHWNSGQDDEEGIFLLFEIFQIRGIAEQFSEISLDIVEFTTKPVIFHSPANRHLKSGPVSEGNVRFWLIREGIWNSLLFSYGRPLIFQRADKEADIAAGENFILATREMFLGPEGDVKIIAQ